MKIRESDRYQKRKSSSLSLSFPSLTCAESLEWAIKLISHTVQVSLQFVTLVGGFCGSGYVENDVISF
jgi:hypothetical protein